MTEHKHKLSTQASESVGKYYIEVRIWNNINLLNGLPDDTHIFRLSNASWSLNTVWERAASFASMTLQQRPNSYVTVVEVWERVLARTIEE